ncbi:hypothetical protein CQA57_00620 [Helicobacter anseris]|uniref:Pentapeptide repeat-containing protein n=1 Tax=Helicobacter anseris TaxID=375926 RepID=A0A3D8JBY4_9HELI|nr:pentapeptide repeat-containing protein [Helicobacter anseris]RDU74586.1 hypothetical protein CQA57_00620 [Helicobacter anseris]
MNEKTVKHVTNLILSADSAMEAKEQKVCFELLKQFDDFKKQNQEFFRSEFPMELQNKEEFEQKEKKLASFVFENFLAKNLNINFEDKNIGNFKYQNGGFEIFGFRGLIIYEIPNDFNFYFKNCEFQGIPVRGAMEDDKDKDWSNDAISFGSDLKNVSFYQCKFLQLVIFNQSEIYASFDQCHFLEGILCKSSTNICFKKALFNRCRFYKTADFSKVKFDCNCDFSSIVVCDANFSNTIFSNKALFSSAKFIGVNFFSSTFEEDAVFNNTKFRCTAIFNKSKFKKNAFFSKSNFYKIADFTRASFGTSEENFEIDFKDCQFKDKSIFSNARFYNSVYFNNTTFEKEVDFHESEFNKIICFYGVVFQKPFNFSHAAFREGVNLVNIKIDFTFYNLQDFIEEKIEEKIPKYKSNLSWIKKLFSFGRRDAKKYINDRERSFEREKIANDYRDSFRVLKNTLIKDNNILDASLFHKLELYCKEIALVGAMDRGKKAKVYNDVYKNLEKVKDIFDRLQLAFYRHLSDHHTSLLRVVNNFFIILMTYFLIIGFLFGEFVGKDDEGIALSAIKNFIVSGNCIKYFIAIILILFSIFLFYFIVHGFITIVQYFSPNRVKDTVKKIKESILKILKVAFEELRKTIKLLQFVIIMLILFIVICCGEDFFGIKANALDIILFLILASIPVFLILLDGIFIRILLILATYITFLCIFLQNIPLYFEKMNVFKLDFYCVEEPLSYIVVLAHMLLQAIVIFSLQKTARKNSIIPS